jgi:serine/threonine protein kinase
MSEPDTSDFGSSPLSLAMRVDQACDRFEAAWRAGQRPRIEAFLADVAATEQTAFLSALLALELSLRLHADDPPALVEYQNRFHGHDELVRALFAEAGLVEREPANGDYSDSEEASTEPPSDLPERYKIERELGGGAFGSVYLAHDDVLGIDVAIKVPSRRLLRSPMARELFLAEARKVASLRHVGIVGVLDVGPQNGSGTCFIVYHLIDGTTLEKRILPARLAAEPLSSRQAARIVAQVGEAVHHAHQKGLIHRDIKPANILLDRKGKPYLADFGLAIREEELSQQRGHYAGTRSYMSPEQVRHDGHLIDGRTDIYSLGVVLYELLCRRPPFDAESWELLKEFILRREARPPRQIDDSIPLDLERICLRALSKQITDRYNTAQDMADEIHQALRNGESDDHVSDTVIPIQEIVAAMASAGEDVLLRMLRLLQRARDPACVPQVFRCLAHDSEAVRRQAQHTIHAIGWDVVADAVETLARREFERSHEVSEKIAVENLTEQRYHADIGNVLAGLAAFESHPRVVALLDRMLPFLKGDHRNSAILLLERKRLGVELETMARLFRDIHSTYRIDKALGQGLFSAAYLGHADGTDLAVVVRVLRPELAVQPQIRSRFLDLHKKALQLVHENLVVTRETRAFPEQNIYFAVRDHVHGVTLQKLLEGNRRFQREHIVGILKQLLAALVVVHRAGVCHGGVKPSNIFVCGSDKVILGDPSLPVQGIGVALERLSYDYRYTAPETFAGIDAATAHSDQYSLGCVAYELACGRPPFIADNYHELAALHLRETAELPSQRGSVLGPAYDEFLLKLLARATGDRFASAREVLLALDRLDSMREAPAKGPEAPMLRDASLVHLRGAESVVRMDPSGETRWGTDAEPDMPQSMHFELGSGVAPRRIGNYEITEMIGRGGMGTVYKARDVRLERIVALKVLNTFHNRDMELRFLREARAVARLNHPNIVQIYDIGQWEQSPYLALEFVAGGDLARRPKTDRPDPNAAVNLILPMASAIQHAHDHQVLHRDLKPSNVLLTIKGEPMITDFGLAKMQDSDEEDLGATRSGQIMGTLPYMAPEQASGDASRIGPTTDVHGLGVILYELLTGRRPYQETNRTDLLANILTGTVTPPHLLNPSVNSDLSAIVAKCLEKDPQKRYATAQALAEDLERWRAGQRVLANPYKKRWPGGWLRRWFGPGETK